MGTTQERIGFAFFAVSLTLGFAAAGFAEEAADLSVRLFDTGPGAVGAPTEQDVAARTGWTRVPENDLSHSFKGAAVLMNDRVAGVLWLGGPGADLSSHTGNRWKQRALIWPTPAQGDATVSLLSVRLIENTPGAVAVQGVFKTAGGGTVSLTYRLTPGQPFVELRPGEGPGSIWIRCRTSYVVVPDFFSDDMVFGTGSLDAARLLLPAESCLLNLLPDRDAILVCAWQPRNLKVAALISRVESRVTGSSRFVGVTEIQGVRDARIWVAFLEGQGLWQERPVKFADEGTTVTLDWKPPFPAKWRAALVRPDHTADSWFFRAADEKEPGAAASPARLDGDRATVAIPPPAKPEAGVDPRVGPLLVYPLDRTRATPLTEFTPVDILRNTLGIGPCQYILEAEGLASQDNPTPDQVMMWVEKQFKKKGGKDAAEEIKERLKAMTEHVGRARARLKAYHDFAASAGALVRVLGTSPEAGRLAEETSPTFARIVQASEEGLAATEPARLAKSADEAAALVGREDAAAQLQRPATEIRAAGAALDRALARCRMAVRWLGVQVGGAGLKDPGEAEKARQVQALAEQVLKGK